MSTMRAVRVHRFGGPEVLSVDQVPWPRPQDDEVLVKVHAASVNPIDYKIRKGSPATSEDRLPLTLGRDLSGTVELLGTSAHTLRQGDPIWAMIPMDGRGSHAEYVVVKAVEMAAKPGRLDHVQAAAIPLAGLTAWQGLFDHGGLRQGQRVLIHGGAGGVGHLALQFAKARGAYVVTTASGDDLAFVREIGADDAIDYKRERFEERLQNQPVDLVLDLVGGETQDRSWAVLKPGGILVSTLGRPSQHKADEHQARGAGYMTQPNGAQLAEIGRLVEAGQARVVVDRIFALDEAAAAQSCLENGHVRGKIVLRLAA